MPTSMTMVVIVIITGSEREMAKEGQIHFRKAVRRFFQAETLLQILAVVGGRQKIAVRGDRQLVPGWEQMSLA